MKEWDRMPFREQLRHNLKALFSIHGETVSPHWPEVRSMATRAALERLATYKLESAERLEWYGKRHRSVGVLEFHDRRFTRAVGR